MIRGIMGKKIGMTQIFDNEGNITPVTVVEAGPCTVLGLKDNPKKVVLGYEPVKETRLRKPVLGFFKKIGQGSLRHIKEFESADNKDYKVGEVLKADLFKAGDFVDVTGTSIGKGFQGGMVRWNWNGGPAAHGSMHHRRVGSIGSSSDPSRVYKGQHMPGHMGMETVTVQSLRVMRVDADNNLILVKGAVPGHKNGMVLINKSKKKAFRSLDEKKETAAVKRNPMKQSKAAAGAKASAKK
ncbi:MAG: 50S ribosomal protein L3 [Candidatus Omnitrophica bacterium]|nr:50S ribosomal protein L3 [Candidatus Omnitrophota bacterium]MDE2008523.1 50S ribosomal protein L3 [Candidatus Omnitrophota bacterium]MDE2213989.1 50S ribosomal protein L3 [Candidatus Omnitrophota bacterium]MDE2231356.1 50S ribosomal protein L3 [Candidatus Omnitrophota bacterium]